MTDFGYEVRAQRGKTIPTEVADDLTADAQAIMEAIGCNGSTRSIRRAPGLAAGISA